MVVNQQFKIKDLSLDFVLVTASIVFCVRMLIN